MRGDMMVTPQRVVSLLDMISDIGHSLPAIANVVLFMGQVFDAMEKSKPSNPIMIRNRDFKNMCKTFEDIEQVASNLKLDATLHSVSYGKELLTRCFTHDDDFVLLKFADAERFEKCLDSIRTNFLIQMNSKLVLVFDSGHAEYLQSSEPPFGREVDDIFPKASSEISEAAMCLAFQRPTATVFHLMRAMELAVERLGEALGKNVSGKVWGIMLADISQAIECMPKGKPRDTWSSVHSHLYHVKQAWRNDTMHPKTTYTETEAEAVFQAVKSFMTALAPMVAEPVLP
jgi:hypothetical protein